MEKEKERGREGGETLNETRVAQAISDSKEEQPVSFPSHWERTLHRGEETEQTSKNGLSRALFRRAGRQDRQTEGGLPCRHAGKDGPAQDTSSPTACPAALFSWATGRQQQTTRGG